MFFYILPTVSTTIVSCIRECKYLGDDQQEGAGGYSDKVRNKNGLPGFYLVVFYFLEDSFASLRMTVGQKRERK